MAEPIKIGKYRILNSLGAGQFGTVYHVFDEALDAEKAIKVLKTRNPTELLKGFHEAKVLHRCRHKHIVAINEANIFQIDSEDRVVLDLEFVPEGSLEAALRKRWVPVKESVHSVRGALLGLEYAHSQGFLHRDVKPANILLGKNTKLSDFGLATASSAELVGSGQGYISHLAPEYYVRLETTVLTDIFAVGVTLFRSVCNISDWDRLLDSIPDWRWHVRKGTLIERIGFPDYVPDSLKRIMRKACNTDPSKRFASAKKLGQRLDSLRFHIDWAKVRENEWRGRCGGKDHCCVADTDACELVVTVNKRRDRANCRRCGTAAETLTEMEKHVASTTML
jgi:serine/threonine-protein kinase